jgi:hypothetical protein
MSVTSPTADVKGDTPQRSIILSAGSGPFVFGRVVSLTVSYRNGGQEPWVVPPPSESISVGLRYRPSGTEQHPRGYSFGRITSTTVKRPDGQEMTARVFPNPKPVSINPGQMHEFKVVLERDWTGDLKPGLWTVWIVDDNLKLESNRIEIPLCFTADSVAACLEIAAADKQQVYKRKEHAKWLQKIMPELMCRWWSDNTPSHEKQQMETQVQRQLEAFRAFQNDSSKAKVTEVAISGINREAGVEPRQ